MTWTSPKPACFLIVLWSVLVHLPGLKSPLRDYHAYRQCQTASMARNYVRHGMHFFSPEIDTDGTPVRAGTEFPIYSYLLAILFKLFGLKEVFGRLLSMIFAAWGAIFLYLFVRPRLGSWIALWSALVMCAIPIHIYFTRTVQPEPMALWGYLGFLYFADLWMNREKERAYWVSAVLLGALAPLLKLPFLYLVFPMWLYLGYENGGTKKLMQKLWLAMMALILALVALWYHFAKTASVVLLPLSVQEHITNLLPALTWHLWVTQFVSHVPELVTTYAGLLLGLLGLYYFRRAKALPLLLFWMLASVLYVPLLGEYGVIHRYTLLPLAPMAAVYIACGISALWEYAKARPSYRILAGVLVLSIPLHAGLRIRHWYHLDYEYVLRAQKTLSASSKPSDLVLVASRETPELLYYLDHYGYPLDPARKREGLLQDISNKGGRYLLVPKEDNFKRLSEWKTVLTRKARLLQDDPDYLLYQLSPRHG